VGRWRLGSASAAALELARAKEGDQGSEGLCLWCFRWRQNFFRDREREKEGGTEVRARGDRHYFMEFWLGLSTNLVRCSEDDGRRKKRGAYDRSEGGGERGSERENIKTGDDGVLCRDWRREITTH